MNVKLKYLPKLTPTPHTATAWSDMRYMRTGGLCLIKNVTACTFYTVAASRRVPSGDVSAYPVTHRDAAEMDASVRPAVW